MNHFWEESECFWQLIWIFFFFKDVKIRIIKVKHTNSLSVHVTSFLYTFLFYSSQTYLWLKSANLGTQIFFCEKVCYENEEILLMELAA